MSSGHKPWALSLITPWIKAKLNYLTSFLSESSTAGGLTHLPETIHFAIHKGLVLPFDLINVVDVARVQVLLDHEAQEAVIWGVS